jgi:hypothetical protein
MEHRISILFFVKKKKSKDENVAPFICPLLLTGHALNKQQTEWLALQKWSADAGRLKGNTPEANLFNSFLATLKNKVYTCERELIHDGKEDSI